MKKHITLALLVMGFSGLIAQVLLLREFMVSFAGNELIIGIILANWLLLEAVGAGTVGYLSSDRKRALNLFVLINLVFAVSFPGAVCLIRFLPEFAPGGPGEGVGLLTVLVASFLILLPVSLTHGMLFSTGCRLWSKFVSHTGETAGRVYIIEIGGTIVGGLLLTYLFLPYLRSFATVLLIVAINLLLCFTLSLYSSSRQFLFPAIAGFLFILLVIGVLFSTTVRIDHLTLSRRWPGQELFFSENSIYGNIAVAGRGRQRTIYQDGQPVTNLPDPDLVAVEGFAHIPLLAHKKPDNLLILSGGVGGVIDETLKYDPEVIDYVELDPFLLEAVRNFPFPLSQRELTDPRVNIHHRDGRLHIEKTDQKYDVAFIGFREPSNLQVNRLFTREFFEKISGRLGEEGILAFRLPGSMDYLTEEMQKLNASVHRSLEKVFPAVLPIPGDDGILYLAANSGPVLDISVDNLYERLRQREIETKLVSSGYLAHRLDLQRRQWLKNNLDIPVVRSNIDFRPEAVYYSLAHWSSIFTPALRGLFKTLETISLPLVLGGFILFFIVIAGAGGAYGDFLRPALLIAILATGFSGMLFDLILIFAFQSIYGYVFYWVGLLITAYMTGSLLGAIASNRLISMNKNLKKIFLGLELLLVLFALLLPYVLLMLNNLVGLGYPFHYLFPLLSCAAGLFVGGQFPLANSIYIAGDKTKVERTAGLLYGGDLLGGWVGGIIGGVALLPLLGLVETSQLVAGVKILTLLLVAFAFLRSENY